MTTPETTTAGSEASIEDRLIAEVPSLRAFARSLARDHTVADDLVQETVLKAWDKLDSFEDGTNLRAWLFTILRNTFVSLKRKRRREVEDVDGVHAARIVQLPTQIGALDVADFRRAFETLPDDQREAIILVGAAGFTYDEAAAICGCATGTIKSRVNRARKALAEILELEPDDLSSTDAASMSVITAGGQTP